MVIRMNDEESKFYSQNKTSQDGNKVNLVIDASGVGFGGLKLFLDKILLNIPNNEDFAVSVIGAEAHSHDFRVGKWKTLLISTYKIMKLRKSSNSILFSMSPSICSLAWIGRPMIQNINDFQSFLPQVQVSIFKRVYRWLIYQLVLRISSGITTISFETKNRLLEFYEAKKETRIIYLSGEIPHSTASPIYDFLIIAHSKHKRANYILELFSHESFRDKRIAIIGREFNPSILSNCSAFVCELRSFENISDDEYAELLCRSEAIIMFSEIGSEGFGLPIAQAIYSRKRSYISEDPALVEVSQGSSLILINDVNADRKVLVNNSNRVPSEDNLFVTRSWKNVTDEFFNQIMLTYQKYK